MSLEQELRALEIAWPETPPLRPELGRRRSLRPLVLALALLVLALAVALAVPQARSAILRFFHLRGVTVERVETLPPAARRSLEAGLGPERPLAQAQRIAGFTPILPEGVERAFARPGVLAVALPGGRLLTEVTGVPFGIDKKFATAATVIRPVEVDGRPGLWLEGAPHVLLFLDREGTLVAHTLRLAGNTLLWERGPLTLRLEGPLTLAEALRFARSVKSA
jgi:hypothetical protein